MVQYLLPSRPALHLCHSLLRRTGSSPTPLMCSSHPLASCQGPTLTCLVSASLQASWVGYERYLEGLDHNSVPASSKGVMLSLYKGYACDISVGVGVGNGLKNTAKIIKRCNSCFHKSEQRFLQTTEDYREVKQHKIILSNTVYLQRTRHIVL